MIFPKILLLCLKFLQILNFEILKTPVKSLKQFLLIYFRGFLQELYQIYSPRIRTKIFNIPPIIIPTNNLAISVNFPFKNFSMFFFLNFSKTSFKVFSKKFDGILIENICRNIFPGIKSMESTKILFSNLKIPPGISSKISQKKIFNISSMKLR